MSTLAPHRRPVSCPRLLFVSLSVVCQLLLVVAPARAADEDAVDKRLKQLEHECRDRDKGKQDAAAAACREIIGDAKSRREQKLRAYEYLMWAHTTHRREYEHAIAVADEMRERFGDDPDVDRNVVFKASQYYWDWREQSEKAVAMLTAFCKRHAGDGETMAEAHLWLARFHDRLKQYEEYYAASRKAFDANPDNAKSASTALTYMQRAADMCKNYELRREALVKLLDPRYIDALYSGDQAGRREDYAWTLTNLGRHEELREYFARIEKEEADPARAQRWCYLQAESLKAEEKLDEALAAYERVLTDHPRVHDWWDDAQWRIAEILDKQEKGTELLDAARITLDMAWDRGTIERGARFVAQALQLLDGDVRRANQFYAFQLYGPSGIDGEAGTDDDLQDPLADLPRVRWPAREQVFAEVRKTLGDGTDAAVHRAYTYLYSGDMENALLHFADALRRCPVREWEDAMKHFVIKGIRSWRGHAIGMQPVFDFVAYGPTGPDGEDGTEDDLTDPFAEIAPLNQAPEPGGLAGLSRNQVETLVRLTESLRRVAANPRERRDRRKDAVYGMWRAYEALVAADAEAIRTWVLGMLGENEDRELAKALLRLGGISAKNGRLHLGDVHRFWADVATVEQSTGRRVDSGVRKDVLSGLTRPLGSLNKLAAYVVPRLRPIKEVTATGQVVKAANPKKTVPGLSVAYFEGKWDKIPDLYKMEPKTVAVAAEIGPDWAERKEDYALRYSGYIRIPRDGAYRFYLTSDDGSQFYIGKMLLIDNDGNHGPEEKSAAVNLKAGLHPIAVLYFQGTGGAALSLSYEGFGLRPQTVPPEALVHAP